MPPMADSDPKRTLTQRLQSGLARRARAFWKRWSHRGPEFPAEAALDWLIAALGNSSADLRATCTETLLDYGCADMVSSWPEQSRVSETDPVAIGSTENMANASSIDWPNRPCIGTGSRNWRQPTTTFRILESRQTKAGAFPSPSRLFPNESDRDRVLAVKHYLDAAQLRVSATFEAHGEEPATRD